MNRILTDEQMALIEAAFVAAHEAWAEIALDAYDKQGARVMAALSRARDYAVVAYNEARRWKR